MGSRAQRSRDSEHSGHRRKPTIGREVAEVATLVDRRGISHRPTRARQLTWHDYITIAAVAFCSPVTVKRVFSGGRCPTSRYRVEAAARRLGYPRPPAAKSPRSESSPLDQGGRTDSAAALLTDHRTQAPVRELGSEQAMAGADSVQSSLGQERGI